MLGERLSEDVYIIIFEVDKTLLSLMYSGRPFRSGREYL